MSERRMICYTALDTVEQRLSQHRFLVGDRYATPAQLIATASSVSPPHPFAQSCPGPCLALILWSVTLYENPFLLYT